MRHSKLLTGVTVAASLAAGSVLLANPASAQVAYYGTYGYGPYAGWDYYAPGPLALGASILGGALNIGLAAATAPFWGWGWNYPGYYASYWSYPGYNYAYAPAYAAPAYTYYPAYSYYPGYSYYPWQPSLAYRIRRDHNLAMAHWRHAYRIASIEHRHMLMHRFDRHGVARRDINAPHSYRITYRTHRHQLSHVRHWNSAAHIVRQARNY